MILDYNCIILTDSGGDTRSIF